MHLGQVERPSDARQREMLFPTTHQLSHEDLPFAVSVSELRAVYG